MQIGGMGQLAQIYNLISYIVMRPSKYLIPSARRIPSYYARTFTPALLIRYVIPTVLSYWLTLASTISNPGTLSGNSGPSGLFYRNSYSPFLSEKPPPPLPPKHK
jgi:hypothetical protein